MADLGRPHGGLLKSLLISTLRRQRAQSDWECSRDTKSVEAVAQLLGQALASWANRAKVSTMDSPPRKTGLRTNAK